MSEFITVWRFKSVDGKQSVLAIRTMYVDDYDFIHEYQTIVYRGKRSGYIA